MLVSDEKNQSRKKFECSSRVLDYTFPTLHTGKKWFVDFKCYDPVAGKMRRKKYHIDRIKKASDRKRYAAELIATIAARLRRGWNVWAEAATSREYTLLYNIFALYRRMLDRGKESGAFREKTYHSYSSMVGTFEEWCKTNPFALVYSYQINRNIINDFLDYIYLDLERSARTRNNYKTWLYTFCGWMLEKGYLHENPVEGIKNLREEAKHRDALSEDELAQMKAHLIEKGEKHFLLACMMEYYTFIRPEELTCLMVGDILVKEQKIVVHGEWTKNRRDEAVALNRDVLLMMVELKVLEYPSHYHLFGKNFMPSEEKATGRIFRDRFAKMRKALKWSDHLQFYSLKDTGIRDLANAEGIVIARDQARHTDVSTTNRYLKGDSMAVHAEVKNFKGKL